MFWEKPNYEKEIRSLKKELADKDLEFTKLSSKLEEAQDDVENAYSMHQSLLDEFNSVKTKLTGIETKHNSELENTKKSVNKQVNSILASIGVTNFADESFSVDSDKTDSETLQMFNNLSGTEKTEFYSKNKAKITRALLKKV